MKKAVLVMVVCLMVIFIFSSQVSANDNVDAPYGQPLEPEIDIYVIPPMPFVVNYGDNITFKWRIKRSEEEKANYFIEIYELNKPEKVYKRWPFSIPEGQKEVNDSMILPVSKENFPIVGSYQVEIKYSGMGEYKPFSVKKENGTLEINKFYDYNKNKAQDPDEQGLAGWTFKVEYMDNPASRPFWMTTKNDGTCTREKLDVGKYKITEEEKEGCWMASTPKTKIEEVKDNQPTVVTFGNYEFGTLKITKYNDTNKNSKIDSADEKLPGWEFQVTYPDGKTNNYITDGNGEIEIDVPIGTYTVKEQLKDGWIAITPTAQVKKVEACRITEAPFGNTRLHVVISKFYDLNRNGRKDGGETGIADWDFIVTQNGRRVATGRTDSNGRWMPNLPGGEYTIHEGEPSSSCWRNSTPTSQEVTVKTDIPLNVEFGNYEVGTLHIHKFNDTNHNGEWNGGELHLPNWGFRIKDPKGVIDITRYTADDGSITVELPANVRYSVTETLPVGWNNSTPLMQYGDIKPCEDTWLTFGNYNITSIFIHKFNDTNGNGIRDRGEEGLDGWEFKITGPSVDKKITNNKGDAIFRDVIPGSYVINESMREKWISTTPQEQKIDVEEGQKVLVEFGNYFPPPPCDEIYKRLEDAPRRHKNRDENLNVTKYLDPRVVYCSDPDAGEIINVTLRVCVFPVMAPTDIVLAVDTSGSLVETGGGLLEVMRDGITDFIQKNEARFGENVRIGLVNWDDDIDETVNLTTDYDKIKKACGNFSGNLQEFTLYQEGLSGSIDVFNRSPREYVKKIIVFVTDAKGEYRNIRRFPDPEEYTIHSITIGPTQNEEIANMLGNLTSQYEGENVSINESYEELEKALTTLTVSSIERRILNKVTVIETLPKYLRALNDSYSIPPTSVQINRDGIDWSTETIVWDIGDLSSDKCWENTFQAIFCCRMPADETHPVGVPKKTSEVTYTDPTNSSITKHMLIPEGGIWIQPRPWWERVPVGLWALLGAMAIAIIALVILYRFRRTPKQET